VGLPAARALPGQLMRVLSRQSRDCLVFRIGVAEDPRILPGATDLTSSGKLLGRAAFALFMGCCASIARPCSVSPVQHTPFTLDNYAFYGEVIGHVSMRIQGCENSEYPQGCSPSWGLRLRILEPLHVPARRLSEVEYFSFETGADCRALPMPEGNVRLQYPVGTRIALAARLFTWEEPGPRRIRLTSLFSIRGDALVALPKDTDLRKLAATHFDYASFLHGRDSLMIPPEDRARVSFELSRDTVRLYESRNESEALAILLRMTSVNSLGRIQEDGSYSALEQLVDQYLPTPAAREQLLRRARL
jgi:hypothetical protein